MPGRRDPPGRRQRAVSPAVAAAATATPGRAGDADRSLRCHSCRSRPRGNVCRVGTARRWPELPRAPSAGGSRRTRTHEVTVQEPVHGPQRPPTPLATDIRFRGSANGRIGTRGAGLDRGRSARTWTTDGAATGGGGRRSRAASRPPRRGWIADGGATSCGRRSRAASRRTCARPHRTPRRRWVRAGRADACRSRSVRPSVHRASPRPRGIGVS